MTIAPKEILPTERESSYHDGRGRRREDCTTSDDARFQGSDFEARFFDLTLDLLAVGGFDGGLRRVNSAWTQTLGWSQEEMLAAPYASLIHPDDLAANLDEVSGTTIGAETVSYEARFRCRDGTYRWMLASVRADREAQCVYIAAKDVHERRAAEEQLRATEAELRRRVELEGLVTAMSTRFLGAHEDELQVAVKDALRLLCEHLDLDRAYVIKSGGTTPAIQLFVEWWRDGVEQRSTPIPDLPVDAQRFWVRTLRGIEPVHVPDVGRNTPEGGDAAMKVLDADGVKSILFVPLRARDESAGFMGFEARRHHRSWSDDTVALMRTVGELFVGAVERSRAEAALEITARELEVRNEELERSNQELEQFASIVSHDLKSPLQVVRGFVELLGRQAEADPTRATEVQTYVAAALRGAGRMDRLIDDLLAYSRAGQRPSELQPVDLDVIAAEVLADSASIIDETDAAIHVEPLPTVPGDPTQLRQLLQNLVTNAMKFRRPDVAPVVRIAATDDGRHWKVAVEDNGIGIDAEHREEIFAMFSRLHHGDRPGSGIGLAICSRVVANHGGTIWAEDAPGDAGSRFCFTLAKGSPARSR